MTPQPGVCPQCGSRLIRFRENRGDWFCDDCDHRWVIDPPGPPAGAPRPRLFLSYGRRDAAELAERLRLDLEASGYDVWQDTRRIRAGREWELEIEDGLRSTQIVLALLSPHAVRKGVDPHNPGGIDSAGLDEISFARFTQPPKPIVPVMAVSCEPPFCIFRLDYIDLGRAMSGIADSGS